MRFAPIILIGLAAFCCCTKEQNQPAENKPETIEERYPDYRPKTSPDTVRDYRPQLTVEIEKLPEARLENLHKLLALLRVFEQESEKNPGKEEEGNVILGADPKQYVPSDAELVQSEIGDRIKAIVDAASKEQLAAALEQAKIAERRVEYGAIAYRHVDVMGSGRFFYASAPAKTIIYLVKP